MIKWKSQLLNFPPIPKIDNSGKTCFTNSKPNSEKLKHILATTAKLKSCPCSKIDPNQALNKNDWEYQTFHHINPETLQYQEQNHSQKKFN